MKYIVLIGDGMADYKLKELNNKTPLQVANTPTLDKFAKYGSLGRACFLFQGLPVGSDVALLSILGYNPKEEYSGRAGFEAKSMGIEEDKGYFFRANLITIGNSRRIISYSAGHISTEDAKILINFLNQKLAEEFNIRFYPGVSYRHILHIKNKENFDQIICTPPHDIIGKNYKKYLPYDKSNKNTKELSLLKEIILKSYILLENHPLNKKRNKENKANMVWLWGGGRPVKLSLFRMRGKVIAAVDLVKGVGKATGLETYTPPGATGYIDTDYSAKAQACIDALKDYDFVLVHVEAPDEASHNGNFTTKIKAIEDFDSKLVKPIYENLKEYYKDYKILVLTDHLTPIHLRTHQIGFVPFVIFSASDTKKRNKLNFDEESMFCTDLVFEKGYELMNYFLG